MTYMSHTADSQKHHRAAGLPPAARFLLFGFLHNLRYTSAMASEVRFSAIKKMLEDKGYMLARIHGSHHVFTKPGARPVPIPVHKGKVKPAYARMIQNLEA